MGWHHDWMGGMGGFMFPGFGLIVIVLLIIVIVWALGRNRLGGGFSNDLDRGQKLTESPMDTIKQRYANGEISREEFEQMKQDLLD
jgi:putative membrane protein